MKISILESHPICFIVLFDDLSSPYQIHPFELFSGIAFARKWRIVVGILAQGSVAITLIRVPKLIFHEYLCLACVPFSLLLHFFYIFVMALELLSFFFESMPQFGAMNFECLSKSYVWALASYCESNWRLLYLLVAMMVILRIILVHLLLADLGTLVSRLLFLFGFCRDVLNFLFWVRLFGLPNNRSGLIRLVGKLPALILGDQLLLLLHLDSVSSLGFSFRFLLRGRPWSGSLLPSILFFVSLFLSAPLFQLSGPLFVFILPPIFKRSLFQIDPNALIKSGWFLELLFACLLRFSQISPPVLLFLRSQFLPHQVPRPLYFVHRFSMILILLFESHCFWAPNVAKLIWDLSDLFHRFGCLFQTLPLFSISLSIFLFSIIRILRFVLIFFLVRAQLKWRWLFS